MACPRPQPRGCRASTFVAPIAALALLAPLTLPASVSGQSAGEIMDRALERHDERMDGIENYTVVQRMEEGPGPAAAGVSMYFERTMVDGRPVYAMRHAGMADMMTEVPLPAGAMENAGSMIAKLRDAATVEGTETVDGRACWILHVEDASALDWDQGTGDGTFTARTMTMALDQDDHVLRRMSMEGDMEMDGRQQPVSMVSFLSDYREVEGMLHPFRTEVRISGMASGSMTAEEREEMLRNLAEAREQLAEMPEAQRAMAERMMGGQLERMEQMLADDELVMTMVVDELRVNQGPPEGSPSR